MKKIILLLLLFFAVINCEKDDICSEDTATTALLYIEFYNNNNQENRKNVFNFRAQGVGNENPLEDFNVVTSNKVFLPLKTTENQTQFKLHNNYEIDDNGTPEDDSDDFITGNEDIITISYLATEVYVSRACGFKTVFENVTISIEDDGDKWIDFIQSTTDNEPITNATEAHFNLFH